MKINNTKKRKNRNNKKSNIFKKIVIVILIFSLLFIIFPRAGVYVNLFDKVSYTYTDNSTSEIIKDIDELSPKTKELAIEFLERCEANGLSVKITETYRTQKRQDMLFEQGRTTSGPVVTWTRNSKHTSRRAFDICEDKTDDPYGDLEFFRKCAEIGKEVGLAPGFYFEETQDMPHYELNRWWMP